MQPPKVVRRNPNATTAIAGTGPGAFVIWLLGELGVNMPAWAGAFVAGAVISAWLAFAHLGVLGVWARFLRGDHDRRASTRGRPR